MFKLAADCRENMHARRLPAAAAAAHHSLDLDLTKEMHDGSGAIDLLDQQILSEINKYELVKTINILLRRRFAAAVPSIHIFSSALIQLIYKI